MASVIRDKELVEIPAEDVVPGDIIEVRVGYKVPADARIIEIMSVSFKVEQSGLTGSVLIFSLWIAVIGENVAVEKTDEVLNSSANGISDQHNMIFSGV